MQDTFNNDPGPMGSGMPPYRPSHGQAALLLTESLMHCLVAKGDLTREDFIEIVEGAAEVEQELVATSASAPADYSSSHLYPLADAFKKELGR